VPRLEALEDRALPSTFTVRNLLDSGAGSLRAAVAEVDVLTHIRRNRATTSDDDIFGSITLI
jgi:hypothetical protein